LVGVLAQYWNHADQMERLRDKVLQGGTRRSEPRSAVRRSRQLTKDEVGSLVAARLAGAEINELAEQFGVHRATVISLLGRAGAPHRRRQGRRLSPDRLVAAGELYVSGVNLIEVAAQFDVDRRYLRTALPEVGFVLRAPGRQKERP
jgi:transposase-like protein